MVRIYGSRCLEEKNYIGDLFFIDYEHSMYEFLFFLS